jgi:hypothetical protein
MEVTMKKIITHIVILAMLAAAAGAPAFAQQAAAKTPPPQKAPEKAPAAQTAPPAQKTAEPDRAVVPLSNPAKPAKVEASVMRGSITVKGYEGKEVIAEARIREKPLGQPEDLAYAYAYAGPGKKKVVASQKDAEEMAKELYAAQKEIEKAEHDMQKDMAYAKLATPYPPGQEEKKERSHEGMKLITAALTGLTVTEENNTVTVNTDSWKYAVDLTIQVPYACSLELTSSMEGLIVVENVTGELEIKGGNGSVTLRNVSGNAVVHTMNGDIEVVLSKVSPDKPLSFSNMNGDVDITLPADIKASVKLKSQMGNIYSDFDIVLKSSPQKAENVETGDRGHYRISFDKGLLGTINGGGQEISLTTFNGDIFIRKKK